MGKSSNSRLGVVLAAWAGTIALSLLMQACSQDSAPAAPVKGATKSQGKADSTAAPSLTAQEQLDACARKYAGAISYRDEGDVATVIGANGVTIDDVKPFATAFERGGQFHWHFRHGAMPGVDKNLAYHVWSKDQKNYESYWDLNKQRSTVDSLDMAMAAPTGVSGGSATVVIPMLRTDMRFPKTTDLSEPVDAGREDVDGVECVKIQGEQHGIDHVTLWIDPALLIRKVYIEREIDPSKTPMPGGQRNPITQKFTAKITITLRPVIGEKIDAKLFEPPEHAMK